MMPGIAKAYIALVIASGTMILLLAAGSWSSASLGQFAIYLGLAALASTLKVRIPGLESTMSPNFVFLLLGMTACRFAEVVAISLTAALVQSLWASAKRPRLVQVAFSAATLVLSSSVAFKFSHSFLAGTGTESAVAGAILAGSLYFPVNSVLVAVVIGLVDGQPLKQVGQRCYECVFPYFVGGIVFAGLVSGAFARSTMWIGALALVPVVVLAYVYFLHSSARAVPARIRAASEEEEYPVEITS